MIKLTSIIGMTKKINDIVEIKKADKNEKKLSENQKDYLMGTIKAGNFDDSFNLA